MIRSLFAATLLLCAASASAWAADSGWSAPGWYLTYITSDLVVAGPYANEADCNADMTVRTQSNPDFAGDLTCEYLSKEPE